MKRFLDVRVVCTGREDNILWRLDLLCLNDCHTPFPDAIRGTKYGVVFELMLSTGIRPSEALGCGPGDVDVEEGTLLIERALDETTRVLKPTKTYEVRRVDLDHFPECYRVVEQYLPWLCEQSLLYGWGEPVWLFPNKEGEPLDLSKVRKEFRRILKQANIPYRWLYEAASYVRVSPPGRKRTTHVHQPAAPT